jgi:hypothetical protein
MNIGLRAKCPLYLSGFNENLIFPNRFSINTQIPNFMKIRLVAAESVPWGQADRHDQANSYFSQFCERAFKKKKKEKTS